MCKERSEKECEASTSKAVVLLSSTSSSSSSENENSTEGSISDEAEEPCSNRSRATKKIVTPLAAALDRTCVSDRRATVILTEAAISLGHDPHKLAIN